MLSAWNGAMHTHWHQMWFPIVLIPDLSGRSNSPSHLLRPLYSLQNLRVAKKTTLQARKAAVQILRAVTVRSPLALLLNHEAVKEAES